MATTVLIIGASGRIGSRVVKELDKDNEGIAVRLATSRVEVADQWRAEGREAVVLDLNHPEHFDVALEGVGRVFLLTGYTADMLYQSKMFVDAAVKASVNHIVHLGVFNSGHDMIPHYAWHELIETYIQASGIAWTHLHPNVILDYRLRPTRTRRERECSVTVPRQRRSAGHRRPVCPATDHHRP